MKSQRPKRLQVDSPRPFGGAGAFGTPVAGPSLSYIAKPPDFGRVSDARIVVLFQKLAKKNATTKERALEELVAFAADHPFSKDGGVEDGVLDVWVCL
jgi:E3 ubiquitin-protein ligase listerin